MNKKLDVKLKIILIGFGYWGKNLARILSIHPKCTLSIIVDENDKLLEIAKSLYPNITTYTNYKDAIINDEIDAVIVSTPVSTHFEIVKDSLVSGKHVLCEKLLSDSLENVKSLIELSNQLNLILEVDFTFLHNSIVHEIDRIITNKELGKLTSLTFKRTGFGPIRSDVDVIYDLVSHDLSMLVLWVGLPDWVIASASYVLGNQRADISFIQLGYKNGLIANFHVSWVNPLKQRLIEVVFQNGMLVFDDVSPSEKLKIIKTNNDYSSALNDFSSFQLSIKSGDIVIPNISYPEPLSEQINDFVNRVHEFDDFQQNDANMIVYNCSKILEAISYSIRNNSQKVLIK